MEMLDHWLRNIKVEPTWKDVDEALSKMESSMSGTYIDYEE